MALWLVFLLHLNPMNPDYLHVIWAFRLYYVTRNWKIMIVVMRNVITRKKLGTWKLLDLHYMNFSLNVTRKDNCFIWTFCRHLAYHRYCSKVFMKICVKNPPDFSCMYSRSTTSSSYMDYKTQVLQSIAVEISSSAKVLAQSVYHTFQLFQALLKRFFLGHSFSPTPSLDVQVN